jgi:thiamine biosynthesis lipoprotein
MNPVTFARSAMATRFELVLYGEDAGHLRAAGEEALSEIARLEAQLSLYRPESEISALNARAADGPVPVDPRLFALLARAGQLSEATEGAFDITVAPLMRCWGFMGGAGRLPSEEEIAAARERVGMRHVLLDAENFTVQFERPGMMLDLGAIGKGYAVDRAIRLLRDNGITRALLHGGTSTVYGLGAPPEAEAWTIAIRRPFATDPEDHLTHSSLRDTALSVSAPHGKAFEADGRRYGHVLDPRTGRPAESALLAAVVTESAIDSDALSTALLTLGTDGLPLLAALYPDAHAFVVPTPGRGEPKKEEGAAIAKKAL